MLNLSKNYVTKRKLRRVENLTKVTHPNNSKETKFCGYVINQEHNKYFFNFWDSEGKSLHLFAPDHDLVPENPKKHYYIYRIKKTENDKYRYITSPVNDSYETMKQNQKRNMGYLEHEGYYCEVVSENFFEVKE